MLYQIEDEHSPGYDHVLREPHRYLDTAVVQAIFLHRYSQEFFDCLETELIPKVLEDIFRILQSRWAEEISKKDFYHVHILGNPYTAISTKKTDVKKIWIFYCLKTTFAFYTTPLRKQDGLLIGIYYLP